MRVSVPGRFTERESQPGESGNGGGFDSENVWSQADHYCARFAGRFDLFIGEAAFRDRWRAQSTPVQRDLGPLHFGRRSR